MENSFDSCVGYSSPYDIDYEKSQHTIEIVRNILDIFYKPKNDDLLLAAGCGNGQEAILLNRSYHLKTFGVDLFLSGVSLNNKGDVCLQQQNLTDLKFNSYSFGLIYCYHVLEHIENYIEALNQLHRVLKKGGILFVGFPNKNRLVGYIGSQSKATIFDKIKWNLNDYRKKFKGKFENKYGAHAGFTEKEFMTVARQTFAQVVPVRNTYMRIKYKKYKIAINLLIRLHLSKLFPSNYYICQK